MNDLSYIEELGIGEQPSDENTDSQQEEITPNESNEDFVQDSDVESETNESQEETEPNEMAELKKMIEGMEKRIADKDEYIEKLREESKSKESKEVQEEEVVDEEDSFWEDPVGKYKELQKTIQMQQMQIQETIYANTVEGYWDTVNQDALKEAVATDTEFANKFRSSKEPYKMAYEYLSAKTKEKTKSQEALKEQIRKELLAEMNVKQKKETVPSTANLGGKSDGSKNNATEDGFASVFGTN